MSLLWRVQGNIRLVLDNIPFLNTSATKQLLTRATDFLKSGNLQAYFQSLSDAIQVSMGIDEDEDPERFDKEFNKLDNKLRK